MSNIQISVLSKPTSFQRPEKFARAILSVPNEEIDAVEKQEEKRKAQDQATVQEKPVK